MGACASELDPAELLDLAPAERPGPTPAEKTMQTLESPIAAKWGRKSSTDSATTAATSSLDSCDLDSEWGFDQLPSLEDAFEVDATPIGEGSFGSVHKGKCIRTGAVRAVKQTKKGQADNLTELMQEIEIMRMMDNPNIVRLVETYEDSEKMSLVMELCGGGDLFDRVIQSGHLSEREAATVMQQILHVVSYMHENGVIHRDLKPENFLLHTENPIEQNTVKLIDFGLSCFSELGEIHTEVVGTPRYTAPEVFNRRYGRTCDLWSCGVILYVLLSGRTPFGGRHVTEICRKVCEGNYSFRGSVWRQVSDGAKDLIGMLLELDAEKRFSSQQALSHDWIVTASHPADGGVHESSSS